MHHLSALVFLTVQRNMIFGSGVTNIPNADLVQPIECSQPCELTLGAVKYVGPSTSFTTRAYNGNIPGPTMRVTPGTSLFVNLKNDLEDVDNYALVNGTGGEAGDANSPQLLNTTNLHTHGLHVSPSAPGDDIKASISPGQSRSYEFKVPAFHMGGTFWYHNHFHGSTGVQVGGGAAGLLIVDDIPGDIPEAVANMPEILMMIHFMDLIKLYDLQDDFNSEHMLVVNGSTDDIMLVNGQTDPVISMDANKWYRWRMAFTSLETTATFSLNDASCEMQLIAKDGIYLEEAPRVVNSLPLYPAARCDVAVRCSGETSLVKLTAAASKFRDQRSAFFDVLTLNVSTINKAHDSELELFVVNRPCYQANSSAVPDHEVKNFELDLTTGGARINGLWFNSSRILESFQIGDVVELTVDGSRLHPVHMHINPMQILSIQSDTNYFQAGDWHDTIWTNSQSSKSAVARFFVSSFSGLQMIHCHFATHEDNGMMAMFHIEGDEGGMYPDVKALSPTCYTDIEGRSAFSVEGAYGVSSMPSPISTSKVPTLAPFITDEESDKLSSSAAAVLSAVGILACIAVCRSLHCLKKSSV